MEQPKASQIKRTALYERHQSSGAKLVNFCGWEMPIQYKGILEEHHAVRNKAGVFDVSHMGRIGICGPQAEEFVDFLCTNKISGKKDFSATYTTWCNQEGFCIDDVIVYRQNKEHLFAIVNACNREKDLNHVIQQARLYDVDIEDHFSDGIIALQGPEARNILKGLFPEVENLKPMQFIKLTLQGKTLFVSCTGYTGADGFEIYTPKELTLPVWDQIMQVGGPFGLMPVGLGARDTLRLEMGFALYGHELSEAISPLESVSNWTVKLDKPKFLGKEALQKMAENPEKRVQKGFALLEKGIAREGYTISKGSENIGVVTSGTFSPTLQEAIGIGMFSGELNEGEEIEIQIRQNKVKAKIVKLPFLKK